MNVEKHTLNRSKYSHTESEDQLTLFSNGDIQFAVLCDGAGGYGGGYEAACACVTKIQDYLFASKINNPDELPELISSAIYQACFAASKHGQSTIVVIAIHPGGIIGTSVGDSKAMLYEHNESHDLTCKQINIRAGDGCIPVAFSFDKTPERETKLVIGSDGLWDFVKMDKIKEFIDVYEGESALNLCHREATKNGVFDDFSMILLTF